MSLQSQVSGRLAQLRAAGQLLVAPRPWPGRSAGGPRPRGTACSPPVALSAHSLCAWLSAGVGAWGAAGRGAWVRTWAPLAMAAKVDLSTSTDWKEAKCKCELRAWASRAKWHPTCPETLGDPSQPTAMSSSHTRSPLDQVSGEGDYGPQEPLLPPTSAQIVWDLPPSSVRMRETEALSRNPFPQGQARVCRSKVWYLGLQYLALHAARLLGPSGRDKL